MKRNLANVTKDHVERLISWIGMRFGQGDFCPFVGFGCSLGSFVCCEVFPSLLPGMCPCAHFSLSYVKKVAKQIIKELS